MPRKPRFYIGGIPCHVIQRGNNHGACFFSDADHLLYLECLEDASKRFGVQVHAYVLMTNHVHLLMTPDNSDGISRVMQSLGRRYVQQINFRYRRSGTLWDGRHKSSLIDSETYFLTCMRYIELNPVRANMVERPENYRWSSYLANATTKPDPIVNRHSLYMALGEDDACRRDAYRRLFDEEIRQTDLSFIRQSIQSSSPLGSERFMHEIEKTVGRSTGFFKRGRPGQR